MDALTIISPDEFKIFLLILIRVSVVLFLFPIFGTPMMPNIAKAGLALIVAILLFPIVGIYTDPFPDNIVAIGILLFCEVMIGLTLGLSIRIFLGAVQMAGQVIGFQMGFSMINVVDPQSGSNVSIMEQIGYWIVLLLFLLMNGHHIFFICLVESFKIVHVGIFMLNEGLLNRVIFLSVDMFVLGIKIGAPAIAALLFTSVAFGITAKFAPTMNVMIVAFPVKIVVGLFIFAFSLKIVLLITRAYVGEYYNVLSSLLVWMAGG
ncbi:MAG: flagellar biosynthetic protein FliR [Proteobacteria bacterium]|nr:flagellar biosynthetic protein FliR [Pseudomonadota bacterium]